MGKLSKYLYGIMAAAMLAGCSDELPRDDQGANSTLKDDGNGFFMALDIQMPNAGNGSRSQTIKPDNEGTNSNGGIEVGTDAENNVTSALIVLAATKASTSNEGGVSYDEYGFIAAGTVLSNRISTVNPQLYKATAQLQKGNLESFYTAYDAPEKGGREVYVFVFCNPTADLTALFTGNASADTDSKVIPTPGSAGWMNAICNVIQGNLGVSDKNIGIWGSNSFLMSNVKMETRQLPRNLIEWETFNTPENPFHLSDDQEDKEIVGNGEATVNNTLMNNGGAVRVQRAVARFDFKDGSTLGENTYTVLSLTNTTTTEGTEGPETTTNKYPFINVKLEKMCLVNMSKDFYYLLRVSDNGMPTGSNFTYCAPEKPWGREDDGTYTGGNFVVGPNASVFSLQSVDNIPFSNYFNYPFFTDDTDDELVSFENGEWNVVKVSDVLNGRDDNYEGIDNPEPGAPAHITPPTYKVWRYVTENVIPASASGNLTSSQKNGISTGIVFKGKLQGAPLTGLTGYEDEAWENGSYENIISCLNGGSFNYEGNERASLTGDPEKDPFLYYFDGHLYMGWRHIRQAAIQASVTINVSNQMEINRSTSLYKAVFGDGPISPSYSFTPTILQGDKLVPGETKEYKTVYYDPKTGKEVQVVDPQWPYTLDDDGFTTDTPAEGFKDKQGGLTEAGETNIILYKESANYKWMVWHEAGRPNDQVNTPGYDKPLITIMRNKMTANDITIYQSSTDDVYGAGYYCYYYYWNRHNDNGIPGTMGPMEFAVVRNNVYKLSVDNISRLGHPRIPDNDPDNPTPNTPDESQKIYLDVKVQIVPWVVRLNSIVF